MDLVYLDPRSAASDTHLLAELVVPPGLLLRKALLPELHVDIPVSGPNQTRLFLLRVGLDFGIFKRICDWLSGLCEEV